jgi:hypothetical protein
MLILKEEEEEEEEEEETKPKRKKTKRNKQLNIEASRLNFETNEIILYHILYHITMHDHHCVHA